MSEPSRTREIEKEEAGLASREKPTQASAQSRNTRNATARKAMAIRIRVMFSLFKLPCLSRDALVSPRGTKGLYRTRPPVSLSLYTGA